jgi:hypothetical protein
VKQTPPPQSRVHDQEVPEQLHWLGAHPTDGSATHSRPGSQPRVRHPVGGSSVHEIAAQTFPRQHDGSPAGHQPQQKRPGTHRSITAPNAQSVSASHSFGGAHAHGVQPLRT